MRIEVVRGHGWRWYRGSISFMAAGWELRFSTKMVALWHHYEPVWAWLSKQYQAQLDASNGAR